MPVSPEYRRASIEFEQFLLDAAKLRVSRQPIKPTQWYRESCKPFGGG